MDVFAGILALLAAIVIVKRYVSFLLHLRVNKGVKTALLNMAAENLPQSTTHQIVTQRSKLNILINHSKYSKNKMYSLPLTKVTFKKNTVLVKLKSLIFGFYDTKKVADTILLDSITGEVKK